MIIHYISDLHINFRLTDNTSKKELEKSTREWVRRVIHEGDILLIGGDFSESNRQSLWILEEASRHYKKVLFVTGNHDRWLVSEDDRKRYGTSSNRVNELLDKASNIAGVIPMQRNIVTIEGITFAGDGLWYNVTNTKDMFSYLNHTNDNKYIHEGVCEDEVPAFLFEKSNNWYNTLKNKKIDLFLSHVPPIHPIISPFAPDYRFNSPVDYLAAPLWVCGHSHLRGEWEDKGTKFHMNTVGYPDEFSGTLTRVKEIHRFEKSQAI